MVTKARCHRHWRVVGGALNRADTWLTVDANALGRMVRLEAISPANTTWIASGTATERIAHGVRRHVA
jgi:hypothetical protein